MVLEMEATAALFGLGYIIGMDIGKSLKQQQTEIDLDHLFEAIGAAYRGEDLAITDEEAKIIREGFIAERRAAVEAEREAAAASNAAEGDKFLLSLGNRAAQREILRLALDAADTEDEDIPREVQQTILLLPDDKVLAKRILPELESGEVGNHDASTTVPSRPTDSIAVCRAV